MKVMPDANVLWMSYQELKKISLKLSLHPNSEGLISQSITYKEWVFSQMWKVLMVSFRDEGLFLTTQHFHKVKKTKVL